MTHTPTPWKFVPWHIAEGPSEVRTTQGPGASSTGWLICTTAGDDDAEHIVKCVNAHDHLLFAANLAFETLREYKRNMGMERGRLNHARRTLKDALKKAGAL